MLQGGKLFSTNCANVPHVFLEPQHTENQLCKLWDVKDVIKYTRYKHNGTEKKTFMVNLPKCSLHSGFIKQ